MNNDVLKDGTVVYTHGSNEVVKKAIAFLNAPEPLAEDMGNKATSVPDKDGLTYATSNHEFSISLMTTSMAQKVRSTTREFSRMIHEHANSSGQLVDIEDVKCRLKRAISEEEARNIIVITIPSSASVVFDNMVRELVTQKAEAINKISPLTDTSTPKVKTKPALPGLGIVRP